MTRPGSEQLDALLEEARKARAKAYAPYSGHAVGATVLSDDGRTFAGVNVENASYPLSVCAERTAVQRAVSEGRRRLVAAAVSSSLGTVWPCGGCLQVLYEFGPDMTVVLDGEEGAVVRRLTDLLPQPFVRPER